MMSSWSLGGVSPQVGLANRRLAFRGIFLSRERQLLSKMLALVFLRVYRASSSRRVGTPEGGSTSS